ncbi:MAG: Re/Si-specific NAD(P)(+) transhydrogenase subunit alpha [Verrucomicrobia bacterium]|nr:Re/Si-specific NAD(P)(+) transhydrogenase subunit alpha [Verrucomicrobiota bacterium]
MTICIPKETDPGETRVAMTPANVARLVKLGAQVEVEVGMGQGSGFTDAEFTAAGANVFHDRTGLLAAADMVLRVRKPPMAELELLKRGCIHISFLQPFNETELLRRLAARGVSTISMEMIPRITRAQKMDALTSQANLAGYVAVIVAANHANRIFPMMMTAAGTISPARVLVIGAGVAGLQAIATAKRLGARVDAYDTRPEVEEQIKSLGARFLKIDIGETGQTKEGYAKPLTEDQLQKQRDGMKKFCADADVVITTAQVFGRKAPVIVTADMVAAMKPGSVIVDLAIESGGNVEGAALGEVADRHGVKIVGLPNLPGRVPAHASQVYSTNLTNLIEEFWDKVTKQFVLKLDDEIIQGCLVTHAGEICNPKLKEKL